MSNLFFMSSVLSFMIIIKFYQYDKIITKDFNVKV